MTHTVTLQHTKLFATAAHSPSTCGCASAVHVELSSGRREAVLGSGGGLVVLGGRQQSPGHGREIERVHIVTRAC